MSYPIQKWLYAATTVNVRSGPGYLGDAAPVILATLPPGHLCEVIGMRTTADGLTWHPVHVAVGGADLFGWVAERVGDQTLLTDAPPVPITPPVTPVVVAPVIVAPPVAPQPNGSAPSSGTPSSTRTGNRLGFYLQSTDNGDGLWDAIATVQPPVMLLHADAVNDMLLNEVRSFRAPNTFIAGRWYLTNDEQRALLESPDPEGAGRTLADRILNHDFQKFRKRTGDGRLVIDAWMSLNECLPGPASGSYKEDPAKYHALYAAYDRFQVAFRNHLMQEKIEAVAFNFAAGNFNDADVFLNHFPQTLASYVWLGFHEYGWPSMKPGAGASAAGVYRRVMEGIRAKYGTRHRVIITEAGVTRAYGTPFDDKGWLNGDQPLTQDAYWDSLLWYNGHMNADDYVLGACLYQVGHRGDWATFRHLGRDSQGNPLHLMERIAALRSEGARAADSGQITTRGEEEAPVKSVDLSGRVTHGDALVQGAFVRLLGSEKQLGGVRDAVIDAPGGVGWTQKVTGYEGNLHNAWMKYVADDVAGISQAAFRRQMNAQYGDALHLRGSETYHFPQTASHPEIVWDRTVSGDVGDLRSTWLDWVHGKVIGLTYDGFKALAPLYNPALAKREDGLDALQTWLLPRTRDAAGYALEALTNARGDFDFGKIPAGIYEIEVVHNGYQTLRRPISIMEDLVIDLPIESMADSLLEAGGRGEGSGAFMGVVGSEFVVNGQVFRFIGVNLRGLVYYGAGRPLEHATESHRYETLAAARDMGAKVVRVFLPCIETTTQRTIDLLSQTLDIAAAHGIYVLPALVDFYSTTPFRIPGDEHFYEKLDPNPDFHPMLLNHVFYRDGYRQRYLPFVQAVVSAFRDDTRIFAWEVGNELKFEPAGADPDRATFIAFMHSVARTIRQIDPNHLVATGMISTAHASLNEGDLWRRLYGTSDFDFLTVHCYNEEYGGKVDFDFARALNKPFIVEEAGFGKGRPGDRVDQTRRDMEYWFSRGARGYMQWGFMPIFGDNGDGDDDAGMDRKFHGHDYDGLFALYRERSTALASESAAAPRPAPSRPAPVPSTSSVSTSPAPPPADLPAFAVGQAVFAQTSLRVRQTPGFVGKPESDTLAILNPGDPLTVVGGATEQESMKWWRVRTAAGQEGFAAQHTGSTLLLADAAPSAEALQAMAREGMEVQG